MSIEINALKVARAEFRLACKLHLEKKEWKTISQYGRQLWTACLNFFRGDTDAFDFVDDFHSAIDTQLHKAWNEGGRSVGVEPEDMTDEDTMQVDSIISSEDDHVLDLAQAIEDAVNEKISLDDFRQQFKPRVDLWVNRYNETVNAAVIYFGNKKKLEWVLGQTEEHCDSCASLAGIVAYGYEWEQSGIKPQNPPNSMLDCGGWKCDCSLSPTTKKHTPHALDKLTDIAMSRHI